MSLKELFSSVPIQGFPYQLAKHEKASRIWKDCQKIKETLSKICAFFWAN